MSLLRLEPPPAVHHGRDRRELRRRQEQRELHGATSWASTWLSHRAEIELSVGTFSTEVTDGGGRAKNPALVRDTDALRTLEFAHCNV